MSFRPTHQPTGGPNERCSRCGLWGNQHNAKRAEYVRQYNAANPRPKASLRIIGVDGEGQGRAPHVYNFLGAADEGGKTWEIGTDPNKPVGTVAALDFLLALPTRSLVIGFAFLYDLTKILEDLPPRAIYLLFHPDKRRVLRKGKVHLRPVRWGEYRLNYVSRRFSVAKGNRRCTVWDIFAFYQRKFTEALSNWKVAPDAVIARMQRMKEKRSDFDAQSWGEIKEYCLSECLYLAKLGRALITAHEEAGFPLRDYYGAGSTASSLLKKHGVIEYRGETPEASREAIACSFFGGRFENSRIGQIRTVVHNYDISSAYPYAATFLPCLIHGRWRFFSGREIENALERETLLLVNWHLPRGSRGSTAWGPLPVRKANGTIAFPLGSIGGWTWKKEFLAARSLRSDLASIQAWGYRTDCSCSPFAFLPEVYLERCRIGKEGKGQVLKLGPNSVYGKLAQAVGSATFQCWVWASLITSSCRAQLLSAMLCAPRLDDIIAVATDGIFSAVPLKLPKPIKTGTDSTGKPLGGWEHKEYANGIFLARPGVYWPLDVTEEEMDKVKARGLGRRVLYDRRQLVIDAFERGDVDVTVSGGQRFIGAKSGVRWTASKGAVRHEHYGDWLDWPIKITFDPRPKRRAKTADNQLVCWDWFGTPSLPYDNALKDKEAELLQLAALIAEEQPDFDFTMEG